MQYALCFGNCSISPNWAPAAQVNKQQAKSIERQSGTQQHQQHPTYNAAASLKVHTSWPYVALPTSSDSTAVSRSCIRYCARSIWRSSWAWAFKHIQAPHFMRSCDMTLATLCISMVSSVSTQPTHLRCRWWYSFWNEFREYELWTSRLTLEYQMSISLAVTCLFNFLLGSLCVDGFCNCFGLKLSKVSKWCLQNICTIPFSTTKFTWDTKTSSWLLLDYLLGWDLSFRPGLQEPHLSNHLLRYLHTAR